MNAKIIEARSGAVAAPAWAATWVDAPLWARCAGIAGAVLAFGLLCGFYAVVAGAVHRGTSGRELARVSFERHAACSVFPSAVSRDLCLVTVAANALPYGIATRPEAPRGVVQASFRQPDWRARTPQLVTQLY